MFSAWKRIVPSVLTLLLLAACSSGPTANPDKIDIRRPASVDLAPLLEKVPAGTFPLMLTVWPDRTTEAGPAIAAAVRTIIPNLPEKIGPFEILGQLLMADKAGAFQSLKGLDRTKPLIAALFGVPNPELFDAVVSGNMPDPLEAPEFLYGRLILPAKDAALLNRELLAWGSTIGLQPFQSSALRVVFPNSSTMKAPGLMAVFRPSDNHVQIDIAVAPVDAPKSIEPALAELLTRKHGEDAQWKPTTPARQHFLESDGAINIYLDFERFPASYTAFSTLEVAQALKQLPPELYLKILAGGTFNALTVARLMHPRNRGITDMTIGVTNSKAQALDVRITQTLTASEQIAYEAASINPRMSVTSAQKNPLASLYVRRSWRELMRAQPEPTWSGLWDAQELIERLQITGSAPLIYALFSNPWRGLELVLNDIQANDPELPLLDLPHGAVFVVEEFSLDPESSELVAGLLVDLPPGASTQNYKATAARLEAYLKQIGLHRPIQVQVLADPNSTRVQIGVGKTPDLVFYTPPQGSPGTLDDFALTLNGAALSELIGQFDPGLAQLLKRMGTLSIHDRVDERCLATHIRFGLGADPNEALPEPIVVLDAKTQEVVPPNLSKSEKCMIELTNAFERALNQAATDMPDQIQGIFSIVEPQLQPLFACAKSDPEHAATAKIVEGGWYLLASRVSSWANEETASMAWAKKACDLGRNAGCVLLQSKKDNQDK